MAQIAGGDEDAAIVTAVIGMAQSLKLRVVAEGVETFEQLEFLHARHCEEAQGYYFSRPVPAAQFAELLENGNIAPGSRRAPHVERAVGQSGVARDAARRDVFPVTAGGGGIPAGTRRVFWEPSWVC